MSPQGGRTEAPGTTSGASARPAVERADPSHPEVAAWLARENAATERGGRDFQLANAASENADQTAAEEGFDVHSVRWARVAEAAYSQLVEAEPAPAGAPKQQAPKLSPSDEADLRAELVDAQHAVMEFEDRQNSAGAAKARARLAEVQQRMREHGVEPTAPRRFGSRSTAAPRSTTPPAAPSSSVPPQIREPRSTPPSSFQTPPVVARQDPGKAAQMRAEFERQREAARQANLARAAARNTAPVDTPRVNTQNESMTNTPPAPPARRMTASEAGLQVGDRVWIFAQMYDGVGLTPRRVQDGTPILATVRAGHEERYGRAKGTQVIQFVDDRGNFVGGGAHNAKHWLVPVRSQDESNAPAVEIPSEPARSGGDSSTRHVKAPVSVDIFENGAGQISTHNADGSEGATYDVYRDGGQWHAENYDDRSGRISARTVADLARRVADHHGITGAVSIEDEREGGRSLTQRFEHAPKRRSTPAGTGPGNVPLGGTDADRRAARPRLEGESDRAYEIRTAPTREAALSILNGHQVAGLRSIARDEGIVTSGSKAQLVARLIRVLRDRHEDNAAIERMVNADRPATATAPVPQAPRGGLASMPLATQRIGGREPLVDTVARINAQVAAGQISRDRAADLLAQLVQRFSVSQGDPEKDAISAELSRLAREMRNGAPAPTMTASELLAQRRAARGG